MNSLRVDYQIVSMFLDREEHDSNSVSCSWAKYLPAQFQKYPGQNE